MECLELVHVYKRPKRSALESVSCRECDLGFWRLDTIAAERLALPIHYSNCAVDTFWKLAGEEVHYPECGY